MAREASSAGPQNTGREYERVGGGRRGDRAEPKEETEVE